MKSDSSKINKSLLRHIGRYGAHVYDVLWHRYTMVCRREFSWIFGSNYTVNHWILNSLAENKKKTAKTKRLTINKMNTENRNNSAISTISHIHIRFTLIYARECEMRKNKKNFKEKKSIFSNCLYFFSKWLLIIIAGTNAHQTFRGFVKRTVAVQYLKTIL